MGQEEAPNSRHGDRTIHWRRRIQPFDLGSLGGADVDTAMVACCHGYPM